MTPGMPEICITEMSMLPEEKLKKLSLGGRDLTIAVLKSAPEADTRVPLTPMGVSMLAASGHHVLVESGAGSQANYPDIQYTEAGAETTASPEKLSKADLVLKASPLTTEEAARAKKGQTLIAPLHEEQAGRQYIDTLLRRKATALDMEHIQTEKGFYPIAHINSEIAGRNAIFTAASQLGIQSGGKGILFGGIPGISPSSVVIIGTGVAALHASKAALSLGADIKVFDDTVYRLVNFRQEIGSDIFTSVLQPQVLAKALASADVVIGAKRPGPSPRPVVTAEMVAMMKRGSIIIDLDAGAGSCFETSRPTTLKKPTFDIHGVIHYCLPEMTTLVPRTSSIALSNILYPIINEIADNGGINPTITFNRLLRPCVYCYNGILTSQTLGKRLGIATRDIDLYLL